LAGRLRTKVAVINTQGREVGEVSQIQDRGENLAEAVAGMKVAVSLKGPTVGRHIHEGDTLYVGIPEDHARVLLRRFAQELDPGDRETLNEYAEIMRKTIPFWGT
jgi:translation initiation factor 5B